MEPATVLGNLRVSLGARVPPIPECSWFPLMLQTCQPLRLTVALLILRKTTVSRCLSMLMIRPGNSGAVAGDGSFWQPLNDGGGGGAGGLGGGAGRCVGVGAGAGRGGGGGGAGG